MYFSLLFSVFFFFFSSGTGSFFRLCDIRRALVFAFLSLFSLLDLSVSRDRFLWVGVQWWLDVLFFLLLAQYHYYPDFF